MSSFDEYDERVARTDAYTLQAIDDAFDNAMGWQPSADERPSKRRRLTRSSDLGAEQQGGFIVEDTNMELESGGGFIVEPSDTAMSEVNERPQAITLSSIPTALASLGLPPDDKEILDLFKDASSGWSGKRGSDQGETNAVSRRDWRAVCVVLLPNGISEEERTADFSGEDTVEDQNFSDAQEVEESDLTEEEYQPPSSKSASVARSTKQKRKGKKRLESPLTSEEEEEGEKPLSARQKRECRTAFALFFPDLASDPGSAELDKRRLTIKDVAGCAGLLKEKLSAEDVIEMLRTFSSDDSKSPSIVLSDFERIMTAAKLI